MYVRSHIGVANLSPDRRTTLKQSLLHVLQVRSIHQNFSNSGPTFPVCDRSSMWYRPGSEILLRVTQCLSWAKKRGGSSVRKSIRRWGALSALSSDHGFVIRGPSRDLYYLRVRRTYRFELSMPRVQGVHVLKDKWNAKCDGGTGIGSP